MGITRTVVIGFLLLLEAPNNQWNFESFYRPQPVDEKDKAKQTFEPEKKPQDNLANTKDSPGQQHVINADGLTMEELSQILAEYLKVGGVINPDIPIDINEIVKDFHDKGKQTQQDVEIKEESVDESMEQQIDKVGDIIEENGELDLSDVQFEDSSDPSTEDDSNSEKPQVDSDTDIYNNNPKQQVLQHDEL
ncbi:hypothetical protein DFJ63DRAFT_337174 [Scheffersomyces coipomensis]|uniref:uncharacterized protein n=1 Tax=Scheffersomyces coipomensis TaxID=1788519 RepID=UPI00315C712D